MPRYKDLLTTTLLQKEYPYTVEVAVPPMGFRLRLNLIEHWLTDILPDEDFGRWGRRRENQDYAVWAFREKTIADAFQAHVNMVLSISDRQVINRLSKKG